jgi:hypothetical protein
MSSKGELVSAVQEAAKEVCHLGRMIPLLAESVIELLVLVVNPNVAKLGPLER